MEFLFHLLVVLHMVGWAVVLGGYAASIRSKGLYRGVFHGAVTALVAGVGIFAVAKWGLDADLNARKLEVKAAIAVVIVALAGIAAGQGRKGDNGTGAVTPAIKHSIGLLTLVNIVIAVFWS